MTVKIRPYRRGGLEVDIMIRMPNGETYRERRKAPTDSRSAAMRWAKDRERHLLVHGPTSKIKGRESAPLDQTEKEVPTIAEFAPRYMEGYAVANRHKPSTMRGTEYALRLYLLPILGDRRLDELTHEDVQRVKVKLAGRSPKTINNILATLSTMLKCAVEWEEIEELPIQFKRLRVPRKSMDFFDFDEYDQLLEAAKTLDPRYHAFVLAAGDAGMRAGEIRGLWWSAIDFKNRLLTVERADWRGQITTPKHDKLRTIPMTKRLAKALEDLRHDKSKFVFLTDEDEPVGYELHRMWLKWSLKRAGLRQKGSHTLRHTFCSHLAMRGVPAPAIQRLAGHSALATTERYMHLSPTMLESAIRMLEAPAPVVEASKSGARRLETDWRRGRGLRRSPVISIAYAPQPTGRWPAGWTLSSVTAEDGSGSHSPLPRKRSPPTEIGPGRIWQAAETRVIRGTIDRPDTWCPIRGSRTR